MVFNNTFLQYQYAIPIKQLEYCYSVYYINVNKATINVINY